MITWSHSRTATSGKYSFGYLVYRYSKLIRIGTEFLSHLIELKVEDPSAFKFYTSYTLMHNIAKKVSCLLPNLVSVFLVYLIFKESDNEIFFTFQSLSLQRDETVFFIGQSHDSRGYSALYYLGLTEISNGLNECQGTVVTTEIIIK